MRIIALVTDAAPAERILTHIGEPPRQLGTFGAND
jgi:hypothetical protein